MQLRSECGQVDGRIIAQKSDSEPDSPLAAVSRYRDQMDVFWINRHGAIASTFWNMDPVHGNWIFRAPEAGDVRAEVDWSTLTNPFTITDANTARSDSFIAAVARSPDQLDVFWSRPDGSVGSNYSGEPNPWNAWGAFPISPVGVVR
jgi:hypothetical protein